MLNSYQAYNTINAAVNASNSQTVGVYPATEDFDAKLLNAISISEDMWCDGTLQTGWISTHWCLAYFIEQHPGLVDMTMLQELVNHFNTIKYQASCKI